MRTKRFLAFLFLGLLSFTFVSCGETRTEEQVVEQYPEIMKAQESNDGFMFSGISLDTSAAKTIYYVGDEFSADGIKVTANYRKNVDGVWQTRQKEVNTFSIDSSAFDSSKIGAVDIIISYREGDNPQFRSYSVQILASQFDRLAVGTEYYSGLKASFKNGELVKNNTFLKEIYVNSNYVFSTGELNVNLFKNKVIENGYEQEETVVSTRQLKFEGNVDVNKVGTYTIKLTYDGGKLTIDGKEVQNTIVSFVVVNVVNPVIGIEKVSTDDTRIEASANVLDLSNWKFKITRHVDLGEEIVNFSDELFSVKGISPLLVGEYDAEVEYLGKYEGNLRPSSSFKVNIVESSNYNIKVYTDFSTVKFNDQNVAISTVSDTATNVDLSNGDGLLIASAIKSGAKKTSYDGLNFTTKVTIQPQAKNSFLEIHMAKPGKVVLYVSSTSGSDLVRSFIIKDPNDDDLKEGLTSKYNVAEDRFEFTAAEAGVYKLVVPTGGIYVWGAVIATEK